MWSDVLSKTVSEDGYAVLQVLVPAKSIESSKDEWCDHLGWRGGLGAGATYEALVQRFGDSLSGLIAEWVMDSQSYPALEMLKTSVACDPECALVSPYEYGEDIVFEARAYVLPTGKLSSVDPVELSESDLGAGEEDVDAMLAQIVARYADRIAVNDIRPVRMGDVVKVDSRVLRGGKPVDAYSRTNVFLKMEPGAMPSQFLEGVVGMLPGELREFSFEAPAPGGGNDIVEYDAHVFMHEIFELQKPDVTDTWVQAAFPGMTSVKDLRAAIKQQLAEQASGGVDTAVDEALARRLQADIPDALVEFAGKCIERDTRKHLAESGSTFNEYLSQRGVKEAEFRSICQNIALDSLRQTIALDALFEQLELEMSSDDVNEAYKALTSDGSLGSKVDYILDGKMRIVEDAARRGIAHRWLIETMRIV